MIMRMGDALRAPALMAAVVALPVALAVWIFFTSEFRDVVRPDPSRDAAGLRGRVMALAGPDPFHPGKRTDLAALRGAPVVVCRMDLHTGRWVVSVIKRVLAEVKRPVTVIAVSAPGDKDPPAWVLSGGVPFTGVTIDAESKADWGFKEYQPEIRVIDAEGRVASVNLAGEGRDDSIAALTLALQALP